MMTNSSRRAQTDAAPSAAREALEQIVENCDANSPPTCRHDLALKFIRSVAAKALASLPTPGERTREIVARVELDSEIATLQANIDSDMALGLEDSRELHKLSGLINKRASLKRADEAAAESERLRESAAQWQPIETAPAKTTVLVWNGEQVRVAQPLPYGETWAYQDGYGWCRPAPTHFMPLPPPPQEKER